MKEKMKARSWLKELFIFTLIFMTVQSRDLPPKIDITEFLKPGTPLYVENDKQVILGCSAQGNPEPEYEWYKDDQPITSQYIQQDPVTGELKIQSLTKRELGEYQCRASNMINGRKVVALSPIMEIKHAYIDSFTPTTVIPRIQATEGDAVQLTCDSPPESAPDREFKWYKQDENGGEVVQDSRIAVDQKGTLHFSYVLKDDDLNSQEYKCAISNRQLDTIKLGSPKILDIKRKTPIKEMPPLSVYVGTPTVGLLNHNVQLECVFSGYPAPAITWRDNLQKPIIGNDKFEIVAPGRILRIKNVQENDQGIYTCIAENSFFQPEEKTVTLDVTSGPIWIENLITQTIPENRNAVFKCKARSAKGKPQLAPPVWMENGEPIPADKFQNKYEFSDNQQVLTIKNVQKPDDITCFQCKVENDIGKEFDDACLDVIEPIKVTYRPPAVQEITKGEVVNLTVTATTDPSLTLQYKWYFNNVSYLETPPNVIYDPVTMVASINTADLSDEDYKKINGTYIREVFHKFERVNITMEVLLKEVGVSAPVQAAAVDLWWIALVIGILLLVCVIVIICVVCRRKAQEGVYPLDKKERANDLDPEKDLADSGFHDLSRADYDGPEKKGSPLNFTEEPLSYEDDDSLGEYGEDVGKFNEDGSFIGVYMDKKQPPPVAPKPGNETSI